MTDFLQMMSLLKEQMTATLARSDVLRPIGWLIASLLAALVLSAWVHSADWLLACEAVMLVLSILLYLGAYIFCLLNDRDALRSEKYSLNKMAIEKRLVGDNLTGLFEEASAVPTIGPSGAIDQREGEK